MHHHFVKAARRRSGLRLAAILTTLALAIGAGPAAGGAVAPQAEASAGTAAYDPKTVTLAWTKVIDGLSQPVFVTHAGDASGRLFVVEKTGRIRVIKGGALLSAPFLNLSASILTAGEQGLLGLAFHPNFEANGRFYVYLTLKNGANAVNEYSVASPYTADTAAWQTGRRILTIAHPSYTNHNGGHIAFGPDGYLYIGTGDGGSSGDPHNRSQNLNSLLGKMLRINVDGRTGSKQYAIPATNPYAGARAGLDEIWARGLRNPWRFSFDRANGDLWIGDVGQNRFEEIDVSRAVSGVNAGRAANYGWRIMEGRACFNPSRCSTAGKVLPIHTYPHVVGGEDNCSVTGGYVYRGTVYPALVGGYVFGDFCSGRVWSISAAASYPPVRVTHLNSTMFISSFGEDEAGELYAVFLQGSVYMLSAT